MVLVLLSLFGFPPEGRTNPPNTQLKLSSVFEKKILGFFQMVGILFLGRLAVEGTQTQPLELEFGSAVHHVRGFEDFSFFFAFVFVPAPLPPI